MSADLERIKTRIPIAELIAKSGLTVTGRGHTLTTVEHDSLKIFVNNNSWTWYSRDGRKGKALGGSTIDWIMHVERCDKNEAIRKLEEMLDGGVIEASQVPVVRQVDENLWRSKEFQTKMRNVMVRGMEFLQSDVKGEAAREYLLSRGIQSDTWTGWELGAGLVWNGKAQQKMLGVFIPYRNRLYSCIRVRFVGVDKEGQRFTNYAVKVGDDFYGGVKLLCGLHLVRAEKGHDTLLVSEGELNAISYSQQSYGRYPVDVISYGDQKNVTRPEVASILAKVASRYAHVIVCADEPQVALSAIELLPAAVKTLAVQSPVVDGVKLDANALLQAGQLDSVLFDLLRKVRA